MRLALAGAIVFAVVFGWFAVRWQLGNMLAGMTLPTDENARTVAELAHGFSPSDPRTNWLLASTEKNLLTPENIGKSVVEFERVVRLAPYDFRWWLELGRAYEQANRMDAAEQAYQRAVRLAPEYTYPHWQLGNFYLRRNRSDEAFAELKKAAENNSIYRQQVFSIAWDFFDQDTGKLEAITGDLPAVKAGLARFYAAKERAADSLKAWNMLSEEEKRENRDVAELIAQALYEKRFYRSAIQFVDQLGLETAQAEAVQNPGFEEDIKESKESYFGWKISPPEKMDVKLDPTKKHDGDRSLRVSFSGFAGTQLSDIYQTIVTEPGKKYLLSFWLRTENLKSAGVPLLEVINAADDKILVSSKPFPTGTNEWQEIRLEFTAPADGEAVFLRTARAYCGEGCPIVGTFWYDDFKLSKM